jgi:hypothetical protein
MGRDQNLSAKRCGLVFQWSSGYSGRSRLAGCRFDNACEDFCQSRHDGSGKGQFFLVVSSVPDDDRDLVGRFYNFACRSWACMNDVNLLFHCLSCSASVRCDSTLHIYLIRRILTRRRNSDIPATGHSYIYDYLICEYVTATSAVDSVRYRVRLFPAASRGRERCAPG